MRLWTLHPCLLDRVGLVAQWREGLLAQKVLAGQTRGYRNHPQLVRFRACPNPLGMIASFLRLTQEEATGRGYRFDRTKILNRRTGAIVPVSRGQIEYEMGHLRRKLGQRDPLWLARIEPLLHRVPICPMFRAVPGEIEAWERPGPGVG